MEPCLIAGIPERLHTGDRLAATVAEDDRLFVRHLMLPLGQAYGGEIPGHSHFTDQSANSEMLNVGGTPKDVLLDVKQGEYHVGHQIACLKVKDVKELVVPNANTIKRDRTGRVTQEADIFSFDVQHDPTSCIYPHCLIRLFKNGIQVKSLNSDHMKTLIRAQFAKLAELNRSEMDQYHYDPQLLLPAN